MRGEPHGASRRERALALAVTALACALFSIYSVATPLFEASDELWHYPFVEHLLRERTLPVQTGSQDDAVAPWRQEASQPPLYYALAALISAPFDHSDWREVRRINVHADMGVPLPDGNANAMLHGLAEAWPWQGPVLAVRAARLLSVLMSTFTVWCVYLIACELFPAAGRGLLRLGSMLLCLGVPMFAFISGAINNDNAAVMFSTLGLWLALRMLRQPALRWQDAFSAGVVTGLGALSKSSTLGLAGLFGLAAVLHTLLHLRALPDSERRAAIARTLPRLITFGALMLGVTLLISGWWFVRNVQLYGDVLGWNGFLAAVGKRDPPATWAQLWSEREGFAWSYWGVFGTLNVIYPPWIYALCNGIGALALVTCLATVLRKSLRLQALSLTRVLICFAWLGVILIALIRWTSLTPASQGRLMFPAIGVIACAMAYGFWKLHRFVLPVACALLLALSAWTPLGLIAPTYAVPPNNHLSGEVVAKIDARFATALTLLGARVLVPTREAGRSRLPEPDAQTRALVASVAPGESLEVVLYWRLERTLPENYSIFVHAVDAQGVIIAQRDMHPGQGNLALAEQAAGREWFDRYQLRIPAWAAAPRELRIRVGVYSAQSGARLQLAAGEEFSEFASVTLLAAPAQDMLSFAHGPVLRSYEVAATAFAPGTSMIVQTRWRTQELPDRDYTVSLQLLDDASRKIAARDLVLAPNTWQRGQDRDIPITLDIARDAPPGVYRLLLVWYVPDGSFEKITALGPDGQVAGNQIELTRLRVK